MPFLLDTNVLFAVFKGDSKVKQFIENSDCSLDVTVYVECVQGSKSNREKQVIQQYLSSFRLYYQTPSISRQTIDLIERYSNSHGLLLPDAQIAAVCLVQDLSLLTFNSGDFRFITGLDLPDIEQLLASAT